MVYWKRRIILSMGALLLLLIPTAIVRAHAELVTADPADGAVLDRAPPRVRLSFSEPIERDFFALEVYSQERIRVDRGDVRIPTDNVAALEAGLADITPGTYTVAWRVLSIDGHVVRGVYAFSVGTTAPGVRSVLSLPATGAPVQLSATVRWLTYLCAFILVGSFGFIPFILQPTLTTAALGRTELSRRAGQRQMWTAWPSIALLLVLGLAALVLQATDATGVPLREVFDGRAITRLLSGTKYGTLWLLRMALVLALLAVVAVTAAEARPRWWVRWIGLGLGAAMLLTIAASGHASAVSQQTALAITADWLHLLAGALWIGGLAQLALVLPAVIGAVDGTERRRVLGRIVQRFSVLGGGCVIVMTVTGLYATLLHVPSWSAMVDTVYGAALSGKLILLAPLLAIAAINLLVLHPRFVRAAEADSKADMRDDVQGHRLFLRLIRGEVVFAVLVLGVTGILAGVPPATSEPAEGQPFTETQTVADLRVTLSVAPNYVGNNRFDVALANALGQAMTAEQVVLLLDHREMDMGQREVRAQATGPGRYQVTGNFLSMTGPWQVDVRVHRSGADAQTATFLLPVGAAPGSNRPVFSPALVLYYALTPLTILGVGTLGIAALIFAHRPRIRRRRARREAGLIGIVLLLVGGLATSNGVSRAYRASAPRAVPSTTASIAQGKELYARNCASCHGISGRGDGPAAITMRPRPANLQYHLQQGHTDAELNNWIREGIDGTAMPAFAGKLSEEEIGHVINYIRTFAPNAPTANR